MSNARFILTDSGEFSKKLPYWIFIPYIIIRNNTERPITLAGTNKDTIVRKSLKVINASLQKCLQPYLWDGKAPERIIKIIVNKCKL